jgi:BTB/POZ domain
MMGPVASRLCCRSKPLRLLRRLSSPSASPQPDSLIAAKPVPAGALVGSISRSMGKVDRHGPGDGCITLNVGGQEFYTLRSTVASNAVLSDHVARALANKEVMRDGSVFIDRNPEHFGFILQYLRNRVELLSYAKGSTMSTKKFTSDYVQLPHDDKVLQDLYIEAMYYRIDELRDKLTNQNMMVRFTSIFSGAASNPFDTASKWLVRIRAIILMVGAAGGIAGTTMIAAQRKLDQVAKVVGLADSVVDGEGDLAPSDE